jgi:hypothetical protein
MATRDSKAELPAEEAKRLNRVKNGSKGVVGCSIPESVGESPEPLEVKLNIGAGSGPGYMEKASSPPLTHDPLKDL